MNDINDDPLENLLFVNVSTFDLNYPAMINLLYTIVYLQRSHLDSL